MKTIKEIDVTLSAEFRGRGRKPLHGGKSTYWEPLTRTRTAIARLSGWGMDGGENQASLKKTFWKELRWIWLKLFCFSKCPSSSPSFSSPPPPSYEGATQAKSQPHPQPQKANFCFATCGQKVHFCSEISYLSLFRILPGGLAASHFIPRGRDCRGFISPWGQVFPSRSGSCDFQDYGMERTHVICPVDILEKFLHFFVFCWPENMLSEKGFLVVFQLRSQNYMWLQEAYFGSWAGQWLACVWTT